MNRHVPLDRKLEVLRQEDAHRKWYSLDDQRVCILCECQITGRVIDVWERPGGSFLLHCPTPGCGSTPRDWFYHGRAPETAAKVIHSKAPVHYFGAFPAR